jgi:uncharacterized protein YlzI (FlbEa/FlbD family)
MIKLTRPDGSNVWVKADAIIRVEPAPKGGTGNSIIMLDGDLQNRVNEYPEDILKLMTGTK